MWWPSLIEITMSGTSGLRPVKRARCRSPWAVPSTPRRTVAPAMPLLMQQFDERPVCRLPADAVVAA
jgi:hypothetical protein